MPGDRRTWLNGFMLSFNHDIIIIDMSEFIPCSSTQLKRIIILSMYTLKNIAVRSHECTDSELEHNTENKQSGCVCRYIFCTLREYDVDFLSNGR